MKNLFFIAAFICLISQWGRSQVTCPGANFYTQTEVNQYVNDYLGCEVVTGSITFSNNPLTPITDISGLSSIIKIEGNCIFYSLTSLSDISFNSLDSVNGVFFINFDQGLNTISVNNLSYVQSTFRISNNSNQPSNLSALVPNLKYAQLIEIENIDEINIPLIEICNNINISNTNTIIGFNEISSINNLSINGGSVNGFNSLQSVNAFNSLYITNSINGFNTLTTFPSNYSSSSLESFKGFNAVTQINGNLTIQSDTIDAFNSLTQVNSDINLTGLNILGFNALQSAQNIILKSSGDISGFNALENITEYLAIYGDSSNLAGNIVGFSALQTAQSINLASSGDISGFNALENISEDLVVQAENISGFDAVENFKNIYIHAQSLNGFNNLTSGNNLYIAIPTISGFESLSDLVGELSLSGQDVNGFNFLTSCQNISFPNANNIVGFNALTSTGGLNVESSVQYIEGFNSLQNASSILMRASQIKGFNALVSGNVTFQNNQIIEGFNSYSQQLNLAFNGQKINGFNAIPNGNYTITADTIIGFNSLSVSANLSLNAPYISGFNALVTANQLNITTENLSGFNALTSGAITLQAESINGFNAVTQSINISITADDITGFAALPQTTNLTLKGDLNNFNAFALLTTISESLSLETQRSDYNIFPALQNVESLVISNSPNFTGNAFFPIAQIKNLDIRDCSSLVNLSGLIPRTKYGSVVLINNSSMTNLAGLEKVKNVVNLSIIGNSSLTDIEALDSMRIIQGNLSLVNNSSLNECCVLAFIINRNKVFGFIEISGNAPDCEDIVMVLEETCLDSDGDGIADPQDNCPLANNSDQSDIDTDGVGDMCDNCIDIANSGQEDDNGDGIGNVCQPTAGTGYMDLNDADLYITNNQRGVILKTRSGNCYRIRIDESGKVLSIPLLQCP